MKAAQFNQLVSLVLADRSLYCFGGTSPLESDLIQEILSAPHGANGAVFVTDYSLSCGSSARVRTLHINSRPVAQVYYGGRGGESLRVIPLDEGETLFQERKAESRRRHQQQQAFRAECITDLNRYGVLSPRNFGRWQYIRGQEGGCFYRHEDGANVGALGALRAAQPMHYLEAQYERALYNARF